MKFQLEIDSVGRGPIDAAKVEGLRRLGFEFEHDAIRGLWQERPLGAPVVELADLDMLVRFSDEWGPIRIDGPQITLLAVRAPANPAPTTEQVS